MSATAVETINDLAGQLVAPAKDVKLNLKGAFKSSHLSAAQAYGIALACAYNEGYAPLIEAIKGDGFAAGALDEAHIEDAQAAAALMSMNNVYYRFRHMIGKESYENMQARLRMTRMAKLTTDKVTFELFSIAVSAINGCEMCLQSHEATLVQHGASEEAIHDAIRIAAIIRSAAVSLKFS
jgi:alkyl hydroperoxide reductase subunit D